ncbi:MAG: hypothetical protein AAF741_09995 [Bacteroidota bacterium]
MKTIFSVLISLFLFTALDAQEVQWGIHLNGGYGEVSLNAPREVIELPPGRLEQKNGIGFGLGIYSRLLFNEWLSLSVAPTLQFQETALDRVRDDGTVGTLSLYSTGITLPVAVEVEFGKGDWRPHLSVGVGLFLNIDSDNRPFNVLRDEILFGQLSAGVSRKFNKFIVRPELFMQHSLASLSNGVLDGSNLSVPPYSEWQYFGLRILFYGNRKMAG